MKADADGIVAWNGFERLEIQTGVIGVLLEKAIG
jgi:hypothetical protein